MQLNIKASLFVCVETFYLITLQYSYEFNYCARSLELQSIVEFNVITYATMFLTYSEE